MEDLSTQQRSIWSLLENITENLKSKRLADVFRFISFYPSETYGPININALKLTMLRKEVVFSI